MNIGLEDIAAQKPTAITTATDIVVGTIHEQEPDFVNIFFA